LHSPINAKFGITTEDQDDGSVRLSLDTDASLHNEVDIVHGGIVMLLVDGAMGRAAGRTLQPGQLCATVQFSTQFLAPAEGRISALGRVVKRGRALAFVEGEVVRADGTLVARAQGTWAIR
jgi:uncharacterized protein (TIGR00369 family)